MADKEEVTGMQLPKANRQMRMANGYGEMHKGERVVTAEEKLRADNPGLQELWEQYQTMLKLVTPAKKPSQQENASDVLKQIRNRMKASHRPGVHIEADMGNPYINITDQPPKEKGKIELDGKKITLEKLKKLFNGNS